MGLFPGARNLQFNGETTQLSPYFWCWQEWLKAGTIAYAHCWMEAQPVLPVYGRAHEVLKPLGGFELIQNMISKYIFQGTKEANGSCFGICTCSGHSRRFWSSDRLRKTVCNTGG